MRRLVFLETLVLNDNLKLGHYQMKQLHALTSLRTLHVRNAARALKNTSSALVMTSLLSSEKRCDCSRCPLIGIASSVEKTESQNAVRELELQDNSFE